jgi:hypothetical protein
MRLIILIFRGMNAGPSGTKKMATTNPTQIDDDMMPESNNQGG